MNPETRQYTNKILAPGNCNCNVANSILHQQIPTDDPRKNFPKRNIRVCVSTSRYWDRRRKFGITISRETTGNSSECEKKDNGWAAVVACRADSSKNTGTNYGCYSQKSQIPNSEHSFQVHGMTFAVA